METLKHFQGGINIIKWKKNCKDRCYTVYVRFNLKCQCLHAVNLFKLLPALKSKSLAISQICSTVNHLQLSILYFSSPSYHKSVFISWWKEDFNLRVYIQTPPHTSLFIYFRTYLLFFGSPNMYTSRVFNPI